MIRIDLTDLESVQAEKKTTTKKPERDGRRRFKERVEEDNDD